jgi:hypothetical protein
MAAMRPLRSAPALAGVLAAALAAALAACDGGNGATPTSPPSASPSPTASTSPSVTGSPSPSASPSASVEPMLRLPSDAPVTLDDPAAISAVAAGDYTALAPPGATVTATWVLGAPEDPFDQIAFAWRRGEDPFALEQGFVVWQRFKTEPAWRAVYGYTDKPARQVLGITFETGDLTGDSVDEALTFEQTGGSGACGTWRVVSPSPGGASEVFRRRTCDADVRIAGATLVVREAVFEPEDAHCCPSHTRTTVLEWDGSAFEETSTEVVDTAGA